MSVFLLKLLSAELETKSYYLVIIMQEVTCHGNKHPFHSIVELV